MIYSLHKFETFDHIKKFYKKFNAKDVQGFKIEYDLPKSYKFHKKGNFLFIVILFIYN
jgi:predicted RNA methylase